MYDARLVGGELADLVFEISPGTEVLDFGEISPDDSGARSGIEARPEWRYRFVRTERFGAGLRAIFEWSPPPHAGRRVEQRPGN